jgi:hypothetical protein
LSLALALAVLAGAGCEVYRIETVLHSDSSVDRAIYQPRAATPAPALRPELWSQLTYAPAPGDAQRQGWSGLIADLPVRPADRDRPYFAAWGHFSSPQGIPAHVLFRPDGAPDLPPGELRRDYARNDYVFLVEHCWKETLTDVVTLAGMRRARDELADLLLDVGRDVFDEALGKDYEAGDLFRWLRTEGKGWLAEATEHAFVYRAAHKGPQARRALGDGLMDIASRHGLGLKAQGKPLEGPAFDKAIEEFLLREVAGRVHQKADGKPVDRATVERWLEELRGGDATKPPSRFEAAARKVIAQKYGGEEAFEKQTASLLRRILGVYNEVLFPTNRDFHCTLTVPGEVIETNGQALAGNRVRWQFEAADAWPLGYEMTCRSLEAQPSIQRDLLRGEPLATREAQLEFRALVTGKDGLVAALHACRAQKNMAPLYAYQSKDPAAGQVIRLLQVPAPGR